jgi:hypothetical protein
MMCVCSALLCVSWRLMPTKACALYLYLYLYLYLLFNTATTM